MATEIGMLHQLRKANPGTDFQPVNPQASCPFMKLTTLEKIEACLGDPALTAGYEVDVDPAVAAKRWSATRWRRCARRWTRERS